MTNCPENRRCKFFHLLKLAFVIYVRISQKGIFTLRSNFVGYRFKTGISVALTRPICLAMKAFLFLPVARLAIWINKKAREPYRACRIGLDSFIQTGDKNSMRYFSSAVQFYARCILSLRERCLFCNNINPFVGLSFMKKNCFFNVSWAELPGAPNRT